MTAAPLRWLAVPALLAVVACSPPSAKEDSVKTDIPELSRLLHLPAPALQVQWQVVERGRAVFGPSDWQLAAVIRFDPADRSRVLAGAAAAAEGHDVPAGFVLPWFPPALREQFVANPDGSWRLKSAPLAADAFQSPPLSNGFVLPFGEQGEVLVFLHTS